MQKINDLEIRPTSILLTTKQKKYLKRKAKKPHSIGEYIRNLIEKDMAG